MPGQIEIASANDHFREQVISLLRSEDLPADDLPPVLNHFFIAIDKNEVVGVIGLEQYENYGLLRSLVVNRNYRNEHIAGRLVHELETMAAMSGVESMYLLTETAPDFFAKKGYEKINRENVPLPLQQSSEFSDVCPQTAIVMKKSL